ncbi:Trehalose/maltose import ATP-binding protein MalK [uncultured archaeon]|nr:Trehalose/maltose import ATP-binding protein MalK [uncultured archaeon]
MNLKLENTTVTLGNWTLPPTTITEPSGTLTTILGPSGSGKTTILRLISGLTTPDGGRVLFDGLDVTGIPASKRNVGYVFQQNALFPHMTVLENIMFGAQARGIKNPKETAEKLLPLVELKGFEGRAIDGLSGGEQQRVSIARALASRPKILLLDEPLTGLAANLKETLKSLIKDVQRRLNLTAVYVTHDQEEAFYLSDRICVFSHRGVEQEGTPEDVYRNPKTEFVKNFLSNHVLSEAEVKKEKNENYAEGKIRMPLPQKFKAGDRILLSLNKTNIKKKEKQDKI